MATYSAILLYPDNCRKVLSLLLPLMLRVDLNETTDRVIAPHINTNTSYVL